MLMRLRLRLSGLIIIQCIFVSILLMRLFLVPGQSCCRKPELASFASSHEWGQQDMEVRYGALGLSGLSLDISHIEEVLLKSGGDRPITRPPDRPTLRPPDRPIVRPVCAFKNLV